MTILLGVFYIALLIIAHRLLDFLYINLFNESEVIVSIIYACLLLLGRLVILAAFDIRLYQQLISLSDRASPSDRKLTIH